MCVCIYSYIYTFIYMHVYIERESAKLCCRLTFRLRCGLSSPVA